MSWLHIYTFKERSYFLIITITIQHGPSKRAQKEALYITQVRGQSVASVCKLSQGNINCIRYSILGGHQRKFCVAEHLQNGPNIRPTYVKFFLGDLQASLAFLIEILLPTRYKTRNGFHLYPFNGPICTKVIHTPK